MKKGLIAFLLFYALCGTKISYCQEALEQEFLKQMKEKTVQGKAGNIDTINSSFVLSYNGQEVVFSVPAETKIFRGEEKISLDDIEIGDDLTVKYYNDDNVPYKVISIIDNNVGNE